MRASTLELTLATGALVLGQMAVIGGLSATTEPATVLGCIAFGMHLGRYNAVRKRRACRRQRHRRRRLRSRGRRRGWS